ncbi:MAG: phosphodiester glycosidase family protein [Spirulinaceae cyanobacterium RM2_2_10]|nr:phosphodiester glycosidase family protein [Spirulinaceae cyanobacterium RM2_2_10]
MALLVTPGEPGPDGFEIAAQTTSAFLRSHNVQVAINGSFFQPFYSRHPGNFYPRPGDRVDAIGQAIANGRQYSPPEASWPVLCVAADGRVQIIPAQCPPQTQQALAGSPILVQDGELIAGAIAIDDILRPRTAVGVNAAGDRLWLLVIDGRQPFYSAGARFSDVAELLRDRGRGDRIGT